MKHMLTITAAAMAMVAFVPQALAATTATTKPLSPAVQHLVDSGSKITARFVSASGLRAVEAVHGADAKLFYVTPDGKHLILGVVFDAAGRNVTLDDMARANAMQGDAPTHQPQPLAPATGAFDPTLDKLLAEAKQLPWIEEGSSGKTIYAIFDPNCPYCHMLHTRLSALAHAGKVRVRWIPVSILSASGPGLIAAVYEAKDPAYALSRAFDHILPSKPVTKRSKLAMARNLIFLRDTGYAGVPVIVYKKDGHTAIHKGLPDAQTLSAIIAP